MYALPVFKHSDWLRKIFKPMGGAPNLRCKFLSCGIAYCVICIEECYQGCWTSNFFKIYYV